MNERIPVGLSMCCPDNGYGNFVTVIANDGTLWQGRWDSGEPPAGVRGVFTWSQLPSLPAREKEPTDGR